MALSEGMTEATVRVVGDYPTTGEVRRRTAIGSGFILRVDGETRRYSHYYVLTAAHVLDDQQVVEIQIPIAGETGLYDPIRVDDWFRPIPGLDLAIAPLVAHVPGMFFALDMERSLIPNERLNGMQLGTEVFYIGILTPLDRPMVRTANIGALDQYDLPPIEGYQYPAHLLDCRSYGGFSGAPCFAHYTRPVLVEADWPCADEDLPEDAPPLGTTYSFAFLCGMFVAHLADDNAQARSVDARESPEVIASRYGVGVMMRGQEIREALMSDELRKDRERREDAAENDPPGPRLTGARRAGPDEPVKIDMDPEEALRLLLRTTKRDEQK